MSDFAQVGLITTLQRLNDTHLPRIEGELDALSATQPIGLVLPCHAGDLPRPALPHIVRELAGAGFLREIVVSMNGLDEAAFAQAREIFAPLPQRTTLLRNETIGKGGNVRA